MAKHKRQKPQETATKAERFRWDPAYCDKVEKLGVDGLSAVDTDTALVCGEARGKAEPLQPGISVSGEGGDESRMAGRSAGEAGKATRQSEGTAGEKG